MIDLGGHTLMPAFIDAHSHFSSCASSFLRVSLEGCASFEEIAERVKDFVDANGVEPGVWVTASGYDHNALKEKRHPTLEMTDECAPSNPLIKRHMPPHPALACFPT